MGIRKRTDFIAVHCSATRPSQDIGAADIRRWHVAKGWADIGYHFVIRRDGTIEHGRPLNVTGAHVEGFNNRSVGVCLVGGVKEDDIATPENNFTREQFAALKHVLDEVKAHYPDAVVQGHRDFPGVTKACPSFDVKAWLKAEANRQ